MDYHHTHIVIYCSDIINSKFQADLLGPFRGSTSVRIMHGMANSPLLLYGTTTSVSACARNHGLGSLEGSFAELRIRIRLVGPQSVTLSVCTAMSGTLGGSGSCMLKLSESSGGDEAKVLKNGKERERHTIDLTLASDEGTDEKKQEGRR